jgi:DNA-binding SARP family transcriptional activator
VLWGEAGEENARHSLSQNLYTLRRETGCDWIHPAPKLILNGTATSDVADFVTAQAAGDNARVAELYTGPFLQDFHLAGSAEFERWADEERTLHRNAALRAIEALALRAASEGRTAESIAWSRRLTEIDPLSGKFAHGLMTALAGSGDIVAALSHAKAHEDLVWRELEAAPDEAVRNLAATLRARARDNSPAAVVESGAPARLPVSPPVRRRRVLVPLAAGALIAAAALLARGDRRPESAHALYERGLQAYYRGDPRTSYTLMRAAWEADSSFAMAAFYGWLASTNTPLQRDEALLEAARRLAPRAIDRERLLIASVVSGRDSSILTSVAIAETLAVRYPGDPEALLALGTGLEILGDFPRAIAAFEHAVVIDSATGGAAGPKCHLCNALYKMSRAYLWSDSLEAALRTARRVRRLRPAETVGWAAMAEPLFRMGRRAEAQAGLDSGVTQAIVSDQHQELGRRDMIRWGEFEAVDRQLAADLTNFAPDARNSAAWLMLISLRNQGRLREATALASNGIIPGTSTAAVIEPQDLHLAILAMERGDPAGAARWFLAQAEALRKSQAMPGVRSRGITWYLTLAGTALARAGDTAAVSALVDDVERTGQGSNFGRDLRLHHYLRGLVHQHHGRHAEAVAELRQALHSLTDGYSQINLELARCLMQVGRPEEAIAVLRPALRGGVDGSNTYVTFTALHEAIAQAFERAGVRDSARAHWAQVERAWRRADPVFAGRYARAKERAGPL